MEEAVSTPGTSSRRFAKNMLEIDGIIRENSITYNERDGTASFDLYHEEWKSKRDTPDQRKDYLLITVFVSTGLTERTREILTPGTHILIRGRLRYFRGYRIDAREIAELKN